MPADSAAAGHAAPPAPNPPRSAPAAPAAPAAAPLVVMARRADFLAANQGLRVARKGFVLLARPNGGKGMRYGITVTRKIGNAVARNRMKRRFRALLRECLADHGLVDHDHVLIGREGGIEREFAALRCDLVEALGRAGQGRGDPPRAPRRAAGKRRGAGPAPSGPASSERRSP